MLVIISAERHQLGTTLGARAMCPLGLANDLGRELLAWCVSRHTALIPMRVISEAGTFAVDTGLDASRVRRAAERS